MKLLLIFFPFSLCAATLAPLWQTSAKAGDYVVYGWRHTGLALRVMERDCNSIVLEERVFHARYSPKDGAWGAWFDKKIPLKKHRTLRYDLASHRVIASHDLLRQQPVPPEKLGWVQSLLQWDGTAAARTKKLRMVSNETLGTVLTHAKIGQWPQDNSKLAGKKIALYFSQKDNCPHYLPLVIELYGIVKWPIFFRAEAWGRQIGS